MTTKDALTHLDNLRRAVLTVSLVAKRSPSKNGLITAFA